MRKQFKDTVSDLASVDPDICVILGDVSVYMFNNFKEQFPNRFYNLGICENTLISAAAGLSARGMVPFVHTIAPFLTERCLEQIKLDASYNNFPINILTCGASFDYAWDGATHHALMDLQLMRMIPNLEVLQPGSNKEVADLIESNYRSDRTTYFRLSDHPHEHQVNTEFGKGTVILDKQAEITVMTSGPLLNNVLEAVSGKNVNLLYFHTIKPIDKSLIENYANTKIIVVADAFGLFEAVCEVAQGCSIHRCGVFDQFASCYGTVGDVRDEFGVSVDKIGNFVDSFLLR